MSDKIYDIMCVVCESLKENLVRCLQCHKVICTDCVDIYLEKDEEHRCPHCRDKEYQREEDKTLEQIYNKFFFSDSKCFICKEELTAEFEQIKRMKSEILRHYNVHLIEQSKAFSSLGKSNLTNLCNSSRITQNTTGFNLLNDIQNLDDIELNFAFDTKKIEVNGRNLLEKNFLVNMKEYKDIYDDFNSCFRNYNETDKIKILNLEDQDVFIPRKPLRNFLLDAEQELVPYRYYSFIPFPMSFPGIKSEIISQKRNKFIPKYDLFFCGNPINASRTSVNLTCEPGVMMCKDCMADNQRYHGLKPHHLINTAHRECSISNGKFYCLAFYNGIINGKNEKLICGDVRFEATEENQCGACRKMQENIGIYLAKDLITSLCDLN